MLRVSLPGFHNASKYLNPMKDEEEDEVVEEAVFIRDSVTNEEKV